MTAAAINAPLPFTREAIVGHLQHHATNGPAYVQIQATKALARMLGLFDHAKQTAQQTVVPTKLTELSAKIRAIKSGEYTPTEEDINYFKVDDPLDDDEASSPDDDEVP